MSTIHYKQDTIAAIATAPGKGGVGIIRVSGKQVPDIIQALFNRTLIPRQAEFLAFKDKTSKNQKEQKNEIIDRGIALYFKAPSSYTGEDILEFQGHGGPVVLNLLLKQILSLEIDNIRKANPGEFTERAFLNDKMDLAQAEAVADLIESSSEQAARAASRSLEGVFSNNIAALLEQLIHVRLYIEAALDFPEEEIDFLSDQQLKNKMQSLIESLSLVFKSVKQGKLLKEGMNLLILGQPNAGKSSLLNQLAGKDTAIVTDIAGTTRDVLKEHIHIDGMPLHIIDTAGLRESDDVIEQEGIKRAWSEVANADRVLLLIDAQQGLTSYEDNILTQLKTLSSKEGHDLPIDFIYNKIDLSNQNAYIKNTDIKYAEHSKSIGLSAKTGTGMTLLFEHLKHAMGFEQTGENQFSARQRHIDALIKVQKHVLDSQVQLNQGAGELAAEELRLAQNALSSITGEFSSDDLLGEIFSSFCIGK